MTKAIDKLKKILDDASVPHPADGAYIGMSSEEALSLARELASLENKAARSWRAWEKAKDLEDANAGLLCDLSRAEIEATRHRSELAAARQALDESAAEPWPILREKLRVSQGQVHGLQDKVLRLERQQGSRDAALKKQLAAAEARAGKSCPSCRHRDQWETTRVKDLKAQLSITRDQRVAALGETAQMRRELTIARAQLNGKVRELAERSSQAAKKSGEILEMERVIDTLRQDAEQPCSSCSASRHVGMWEAEAQRLGEMVLQLNKKSARQSEENEGLRADLALKAKAQKAVESRAADIVVALSRERYGTCALIGDVERLTLERDHAKKELSQAEDRCRAYYAILDEIGKSAGAARGIQVAQESAPDCVLSKG